MVGVRDIPSWILSKSDVEALNIGKSGKESAAARFAAATPSDGFSIEEGKPYSEVRVGLFWNHSDALAEVCRYGWVHIPRRLRRI